MASDISWVFDELKTELDKATKHFPPMKSPHEGWAILKEECDEMWDEIKRNDFDGALEEALQVAAMAVRYIHDLQDYTPPKAATVRPTTKPARGMSAGITIYDETISPNLSAVLKHSLATGVTARSMDSA